MKNKFSTERGGRRNGMEFARYRDSAGCVDFLTEPLFVCHPPRRGELATLRYVTSVFGPQIMIIHQALEGRRRTYEPTSMPVPTTGGSDPAFCFGRTGRTVYFTKTMERI